MNDYWLSNTHHLTWHTRRNNDVGDKENCSSITSTDGRALSSCSSNVQWIDYGMMRWSKMLRLAHLYWTGRVFFSFFFLFMTAIKGFAQMLTFLHNASDGVSALCVISYLERRQWWSEIKDVIGGKLERWWEPEEDPLTGFSTLPVQKWCISPQSAL